MIQSSPRPTPMANRRTHVKGAYVFAYRIRSASVFSSMMLFLAAPAKRIIPAAAAIPVAADRSTPSRPTRSPKDLSPHRYVTSSSGSANSAMPTCSPPRANGTHAHSLRSIDAVSISAAYGITNDLTVAVRAAGVRRNDIREPGEDMLSGGHMGMMNAGDMSSLMSPDGIDRRGNSAGFGDVTMLGQYRFHNNAQTGTSAAVLFGLRRRPAAPTAATASASCSRPNFSGLGLVGRPVRRRLHQAHRPLVVRRERPLLPDQHGHAEHQSRRPFAVRHRGVVSPRRRHRLVERD